ncbi:MAG: hypothetical protein ACOYOU_14805, partial [Kiritimatiellia bacterium]
AKTPSTPRIRREEELCRETCRELCRQSSRQLQRKTMGQAVSRAAFFYHCSADIVPYIASDDI